MAEERMSKLVEQELDHWQPAARESDRPMDSIRYPEMNIAGNWTLSRGLDYSRLAITKTDDGHYQVSFASGGCLYNYRLKRIGDYSGGVLSLNRPVKEYFPLSYRTLYAVRIGGQDYLLPSAAVAEVDKGLAKDGRKFIDPFTGRFHLYRREVAPATSNPGD
ncbi:MAG: hypothetical protein HY718_05325 [Planctomycetes bacterium]|nr:hypothetical protein [Planctomycetota bacterium]